MLHMAPIHDMTNLIGSLVLMFSLVSGNNTVKIAILDEYSVSESNSSLICQSEWREESTRLEVWSFVYDTDDKTTLVDAAKYLNYAQFDIVIFRIHALDLTYVHNILHGKECLNASIVSQYHVSDWLFYISIQNRTLACDDLEQIVSDECSNKGGMAEFLADVIIRLGWEYVSVFYDADFDREMTVITDILSHSGVRLNQYFIPPNQSDLPSLHTSYHTNRRQWKNYLLLANRRNTESVLKQVNAFDGPGLSETYIKTSSLWIIWGKDVTAPMLEDKVENISNVMILERAFCDSCTGHVTVKHFEIPPYRRLCYPWLYGVSADISCNESDLKSRLISRISKAMLSSLSFWSRTSFKLSTALWKTEGRRFQTVFEGHKDNLHTSGQDFFPNSHYGLNLMALRVTTLPWPLYVYKSTREDGRIEYTGLCIDLLQQMAQQLNFTYTVQEPMDQEWGRYLDGRWTGLVGDIVYQKADVIFAPISIQKERATAMDFTTSYFTDFNTFLTRMPDKEKTRWMLLLRPFTWPVLVTVVAVFPVALMSLWLCEKFSPYYSHLGNKPTFAGLHHLHESLWYMFGALTSQCGIFLPRATSGRTIVTFWWLFVVLMVAAYCGNLMAFLTVTRDRKPFNTIAELLERSDYRWGSNNGTYLIEVLKVSRNEEYKQLWEGIRRFVLTDPWVLDVDFEEHIRRVEDGNYAFISDITAIDVSKSNSCHLIKLGETFLMLQYGLGIQKNSAYTRLFSDGVRSIIEAGLVEMWKHRWWPKSPPCPSFLQTKGKKIMILDTQGSFYILIGGVLISAVVCVVEMYRGRWRPKWRMKNYKTGEWW